MHCFAKSGQICYRLFTGVFWYKMQRQLLILLLCVFGTFTAVDKTFQNKRYKKIEHENKSSMQK